MSHRVVVIGSSFAGFTAALKLKHELKDRVDVTVVSDTGTFLFTPSLIWVPFGLRKAEDITFPLAPIYERNHVHFVQARAMEFDLDARLVHTTAGPIQYDHILFTTGPEIAWDTVPGLGPDAHSHSIFTLGHAERARAAFERFVEEPGPVVVGAVEGASCFGAAYEFLFNFAHQMHKRRIEVPLTYITPEPFLGHFGLDGLGYGAAMCEGFFTHLSLNRITDARITKVEAAGVHLDDGRFVPSAYTMLAPKFRGRPEVRSLDIANAGGWIEVDDHYRSPKYSNVFAAGLCVAVQGPQPSRVACAAPKTGYLSEEMAKAAAHNIAADITGAKHVALPPMSIDAKCVMDAGNTGIIISADHFLGPRKHEWLIPGPEAHWAKVAFEKYFLETHKRGWV